MSNKSMTSQEQVNELLKRAEQRGLMNNFFFATTLRRYTVQMRIMQDLQKEIESEGTTVTKEYVKGRKNVYTNPAITEYNKTATAANGTVSTLINIYKALADEPGGMDSLAAFLSDE